MVPLFEALNRPDPSLLMQPRNTGISPRTPIEDLIDEEAKKMLFGFGPNQTPPTREQLAEMFKGKSRDQRWAGLDRLFGTNTQFKDYSGALPGGDVRDRGERDAAYASAGLPTPDLPELAKSRAVNDYSKSITGPTGGFSSNGNGMSSERAGTSGIEQQARASFQPLEGGRMTAGGKNIGSVPLLDQMKGASPEERLQRMDRRYRENFGDKEYSGGSKVVYDEQGRPGLQPHKRRQSALVSALAEAGALPEGMQDNLPAAPERDQLFDDLPSSLRRKGGALMAQRRDQEMLARGEKTPDMIRAEKIAERMQRGQQNVDRREERRQAALGGGEGGALPLLQMLASSPIPMTMDQAAQIVGSQLEADAYRDKVAAEASAAERKDRLSRLALVWDKLSEEERQSPRGQALWNELMGGGNAMGDALTTPDPIEQAARQDEYKNNEEYRSKEQTEKARDGSLTKEELNASGANIDSPVDFAAEIEKVGGLNASATSRAKRDAMIRGFEAEYGIPYEQWKREQSRKDYEEGVRRRQEFSGRNYGAYSRGF